MLNGYSWVDRNAGVVRIPIDEAMKLTVQRGLPARPGTTEAERHKCHEDTRGSDRVLACCPCPRGDFVVPRDGRSGPRR